MTGRRVSEEAYKLIYNESGEYGVNSYLGMVNFSIMPHLDSKHFPHRRESLMEAVKKHAGVVYGIRDDSAVVVDGDKVYTIGSEQEIFNRS